MPAVCFVCARSRGSHRRIKWGRFPSAPKQLLVSSSSSSLKIASTLSYDYSHHTDKETTILASIMANDNDQNRPQNPPDHPERNSRVWPDDRNPFIAFRRFADEQISSMLQSVMGIPSMATPPTRDHWTIFEDGDNHKAIMRQRTGGERGGNNDDDDTRSRNSAPSSSSSPNDNGNSSLSSWWSSWWSDPEDPWHINWFQRPSDFFGLDSFFDRFLVDDRFPFSVNFFGHHHPFFADVMGDFEGSPAWPLTYLMFSPYSPLHLERQGRREQGVFSSIMSSFRSSSDRDPAEPQWREAFEDLLRLENGKPMLDRDPAAVSTNKRETGKEWLEGLVTRGSLGDRWKFVSGADGQPWTGITMESTDRADNAENKDQKAELRLREGDYPFNEADLYDRFLQDIENRQREFFPESPLMRTLLEKRRRVHDLPEEQERLPYPKDSTESGLDDVFGGKDDSSAQALIEPSPKPESQISEPIVRSTSSSTERVRLSDGSVETRTVKTKRFADGREETNETVERTNPRQEHALPGPAQNNETEASSDDNKKESKGGWFWK